MLRRSERGVPRLDYEILNETGDRVEKSELSCTTSSVAELAAKLDELSISSSLTNIAKESQLSSSSGVEDIVVDNKIPSSNSICSNSDAVGSVEEESLSNNSNTKDNLLVSSSLSNVSEAVDHTSSSTIPHSRISSSRRKCSLEYDRRSEWLLRLYEKQGNRGNKFQKSVIS